jgi:hypothetical protein
MGRDPTRAAPRARAHRRASRPTRDTGTTPWGGPHWDPAPRRVHTRAWRGTARRVGTALPWRGARARRAPHADSQPLAGTRPPARAPAPPTRPWARQHRTGNPPPQQPAALGRPPRPAYAGHRERCQRTGEDRPGTSPVRGLPSVAPRRSRHRAPTPRAPTPATRRGVATGAHMRCMRAICAAHMVCCLFSGFLVRKAQRWASGAPESGSAADAVGRRLHAFVRPKRAPAPRKHFLMPFMASSPQHSGAATS